MQDTARKALVASLIVVAVVASALALWKLRILLAGLFLALIIAAAMRPSVEWLAQRRIPRGIGILLHYAVLAGLIAVLLWAIVPRAIDQVDNALGGIPTSSSELERQTSQSTGFKHEILARVQDGLDELPSGTELVDSSLSLTFTAFEVLVGIFFTFACAAYWIFERDRAETLVMSLLPREKRRVVRDTWNLIDAKLGAYVRGLLILVTFVASVLSLIFYLIGLPFWLLIGIFAGIVEIVPVLGPIAAGAVAIGVGLTDSWQLALAAGLAVLGVRLFEDYVVIPRVLGHAVGLTPLSVIVAVAPWGSCSAASPSSSRFRSQRCWPRFWTSSCGTAIPRRRTRPRSSSPPRRTRARAALGGLVKAEGESLVVPAGNEAAAGFGWAGVICFAAELPTGEPRPRCRRRGNRRPRFGPRPRREGLRGPRESRSTRCRRSSW